MTLPTYDPNPFPSLMEQWVRQGRSHFVQPSSVISWGGLPAGVALNSFGWLDCPTTTDHLILLTPVEASRTIYWFSEKIVTNSTQAVRMTLEGTFDGGVTWKSSTGYAVRIDKNHEWVSAVPIKTSANQGMRLRVYAQAGNNGDYYFKFIGVKLPWEE